MPRKRPRFSKLLEQLKATGGNVPTTGRIGEFNKFLTGQKKVTQTNKIPAEARKLLRFSLFPFAISVETDTPENRYVGTMSAYSYRGLLQRSGLTLADFGLEFIQGGEEFNSSYFPALVRASYPASGVAEIPNKTSGITGETYNYQYNRSFSFPFGRTTTTTEDAQTGAAETNLDDADELDVYRSIVSKMQNQAGNNKPVSISYEPELFKTESNGNDADAQTATGLTFDVN